MSLKYILITEKRLKIKNKILHKDGLQPKRPYSTVPECGFSLCRLKIRHGKIKQKGHGDKMGAYNAFLQGDYWKNFRAETIKKRGGKCERCDTTKNLVVHHITYKTLGNERPEDVLVLCHSCHEKEHMKNKNSKHRFNRYGFTNYFRSIQKILFELSESELFFLVNAADYLYWDTGQMLRKRTKKPIKYKDLLKILGWNKVKMNKVIKSLKEKELLSNGKDGRGYFIPEHMFRSKYSKYNKKPKK